MTVWQSIAVFGVLSLVAGVVSWHVAARCNTNLVKAQLWIGLQDMVVYAAAGAALGQCYAVWGSAAGGIPAFIDATLGVLLVEKVVPPPGLQEQIRKARATRGLPRVVLSYVLTALLWTSMGAFFGRLGALVRLKLGQL